MKSRANRFVCDCGAMKPRLNTPVLASEFVPDFQRDVLSLKFENDIRWPATVPADAFGVNFNDEGDGSSEAEQDSRCVVEASQQSIGVKVSPCIQVVRKRSRPAATDRRANPDKDDASTR